MIKRITLVEPKNDHLHIFSKFELPRLGTILLATIMRDKGYAAESLFMSGKDILARRTETDLVGISTITATATSAYAIADEFRSRGIPVVFGGPHVSFLPEEALEHGDFCITGEGEIGFPLLVEALNGNGSFSDVPVDTAATGFYPYIETLFHNGTTLGCAAGLYCPVFNPHELAAQPTRFEER